MIEFFNESGHTIGIRVSGKVTHADYQQLIPKLEGLINQYGKVFVLFHMHELHGFDIHAVWDDLTFDCRHEKDLGRCAIVGESKWQQWMIRMVKPFAKAEIKYFDAHELDAAWAWLKEKADAPAAV